VPNTVLGLLMFVVLLVPGFAYTLRGERHRSSQDQSAFRETASVVVASVLADAVALGLFAALHAVAPKWTPDVDALVDRTSAYAHQHYGQLVAWGMGLLLVAVALALLAAGFRPRRREHDSRVSAWTLTFTERPGARIHIGCLLDDGSYLTGKLHTFSRSASDGPDRELTLSGPIGYRGASGKPFVTLPDVHVAVVSARRLQLLTVTYVENPAV
jgi:hypothetical protein